MNQQQFYEVKTLSLAQKRELLNRSLRVSFKTWVDVRKPGNVARERSPLTVNEILKEFNPSCHFVFIDRGIDSLSQQHYFETGFSTMTSGNNHFLFVYLDPVEAQKIIAAFDLKPM